jgi:S-adenosylmethionine synthetase
LKHSGLVDSAGGLAKAGGGNAHGIDGRTDDETAAGMAAFSATAIVLTQLTEGGV